MKIMKIFDQGNKHELVEDGVVNCNKKFKSQLPLSCLQSNNNYFIHVTNRKSSLSAL